ncbi:hypothetical protein NON20_14895 [Synechocystis sp. B12]|nr:hypothetical protein NON20_14895 [Synechocystis sp. B12]
MVQNSRLQVEVVAEQTRFEATDRYYALQGPMPRWRSPKPPWKMLPRVCGMPVC